MAKSQSADTSLAGKFDVFTYRRPILYDQSLLPSRLQFSYHHNDTNFCIITLYKSAAGSSVTENITQQWNEFVLKRLTKADKKPAKVLTGQTVDGWASSVAIGNFYQGKKKCVVMINSFTKDKTTACVVFALTDKNFKPVVDDFSANLHLSKNPSGE